MTFYFLHVDNSPALPDLSDGAGVYLMLKMKNWVRARLNISLQ